MKVCADVTCNTPIPEGKTRCPKCSKKKFTEAADAASPAPPAQAEQPAETTPEPKAPEPVAEKKPEPEPEKKPEPVAELPKPEAPKPEPVKAEASKPEPAQTDGHAHQDGEAHCPKCARLRAALRDARRRIRTLGQENRTLREELLSAGEMIENLAMDLEKAPLDTAD